ncbi:hypothetical protein KMW28_13915 [Flammeovirga yaeyamensis]|uniref:Uncharacterized protein n=1 Tax=Flammeovirga yaeyamensis TaxID=367791 RepID=A0AAX1MZT6_9BACT|nr:hypothetical protein [Flammeovirga yaeyamensis]MBB3700319.1 hypothetical protein [Flammeovirga yaeyamensis]NMF37055.1 hypothetical protein [Flammeovirga yaeyamensis]QWG00747.1 hypothetical protein KMW28_13915 [Flammeovirga yaeyamensis]
MQTTFNIDFPFESWRNIYEQYADESCDYNFKEYRVSRIDCDYWFSIIFEKIRCTFVAKDLEHHRNSNKGAISEKVFEIWMEAPEPLFTFNLRPKLSFIQFINKLIGRDIDISNLQLGRKYQLSGKKKYVKPLIPFLEFVADHPAEINITNDYIDPDTVKHYLIISFDEWLTDEKEIIKMTNHMKDLFIAYEKLRFSRE